MRFALWHLPIRLAAGAFILNSGLTKLRETDEEAVKGVHSLASTAYPQLESIDPTLLTKSLGAGETALGAALLAPTVTPFFAGLGLTGFSAGLLGLYFKVPGLRRDALRPTERGLPIAKDSWLLSMGLALMLDGAKRSVRDKLPSLPVPGHSG